MEDKPKVGVGLLIFKNDKVLLARRANAHGEGLYAGPGGHLEHLESFEACARRETMEEAGIEIDNIRFLCVTNFQAHAPKHYVDIGLVADWKSGEPQNLEPHKREDWQWFSLDALPAPLFSVLPNYLRALKEGERFFDA